MSDQEPDVRGNQRSSHQHRADSVERHPEGSQPPKPGIAESLNRGRTDNNHFILTVLILLLAVALIVAFALYAWAREPDEWHLDDWVSLTAGLAISILLLCIAQLLQRRQAEMQKVQLELQTLANSTQDAQAALQEAQFVLQHHQVVLSSCLGNAVLNENIARINVSSLRSFTASVDETLEIGPAAIAALQLFELSNEAEQRQFIDALALGYSAATLHGFVRTRSLPLAVSRMLQRDGRALGVELGRIATNIGGEIATLLFALQSHIELCLRLERRWRDGSGPSHEGLPHGCLREMYRNELLVHHDWDVDGADDLQPSVEMHEDVAPLASYFSPWYVRTEHGLYREADFDSSWRAPKGFRSTKVLFEWPRPLRHEEVLNSGLRASGIADMRRTLHMIKPPALTLLVYELPDGRRLVLDGNHRLAAALELNSIGQWVLAEHPPPLIVVFTIREMTGRRPIGEAVRRTSSGRVDSWRGFNPDVELLRKSSI